MLCQNLSYPTCADAVNKPAPPMASIYDRQRTGKLIFIVVSIIAVIIFLIVSNNLVKELAQQERERMDIWAKSTERLANADANSDFEFLLQIIRQNNSIPVRPEATRCMSLPVPIRISWSWRYMAAHTSIFTTRTRYFCDASRYILTSR